MFIVNFTKNGLIMNQWNEQYYVNIPRKIKSPLRVLNYIINIDNDVTLRDVMEYVSDHKELETFLGKYLGRDLSLWHNELNDFIDRNKSSNIENLKLSWSFNIVNFFSSEGKNPIEISPDFYGLDKNNLKIGVELGEFRDFLDKKISLDENFEIIEDYSKVLLNGRKEFKVLDFFEGIYKEITFYVSPQESREEFNSIKRTAIESYEDSKKGKSKSKPFKILISELEEKKKKKEKFWTCSFCNEFHGYQIQNYDFESKTGDICCKSCGKIRDIYVGE